MSVIRFFKSFFKSRLYLLFAGGVCTIAVLCIFIGHVTQNSQKLNMDSDSDATLQTIIEDNPLVVPVRETQNEIEEDVPPPEENNIAEERPKTYTVIDNVEFDEEKSDTPLYQIDSGILLSPDEITGRGDDVYIEIKFVNPVSGFEIYYSGYAYMGEGNFWIMDNGEKNIILETYLRYGPEIVWHGENTAEILHRSAPPGYSSSYFNFKNKRLSQTYHAPLYFDIDNNALLVWGKDDFELWDISDDTLIRTFSCKRESGMIVLWPYIDRYFEKESDNTLLLFYRDWVNMKIGRFVLDISNPK